MNHNLNDREVVVARTHTISHIPDVGQLNTTIDSNSTGTLGTIKMFKVSDGLLVIGKSRHNKPFELFIPNGNIVSLLFADAK